MRHDELLVISLLCLLFTFVGGQVPRENFYPFGIAAGDLALPREDDASTPVPILFDFPFFDASYRTVHITTNGIINFGAGDTAYVPRPFPLLNYRSIASYWMDTDPRMGGDVFYRESIDPVILNRVTEEIRSRFVGYSTFTSRWTMIVTFDRVPAYGCGSTSGCGRLCSDTVTYQTILVSNGIQSFAIFNYNELKYTVGTAACEAHAQVGFNAGDGKRFYIVPSSNTAGIAQAALLGSNVGIPGKWMFSIDGSDIWEGCNSRGSLELYPRKVLYFGQEVITIGGPCFSNISEITVIFDRTPVQCLVNDSLQATCIAPYFVKLGTNKITLDYNSTAFETFLMVVDTEDIVDVDNDFKVYETENVDAAFKIEWNVNTGADHNEIIILKGFQIDYSLDVNGAITDENVLSLNYGEVTNNGSITIHPIPSTSRPGTTGIIRHIALTAYRQVSKAIALTRVIIFASKVACTAYCRIWDNSQPSADEMRTIVDEVSRRSPCPPSVSVDFPSRMANFELDASCNPSNPLLCDFFHLGSKGCYRSTNNQGKQAAQCCYDFGMRLKLGPPGGGTMDFVDSGVSTLEHFKQDVIPYLTCCICNLFSNQCSKYYEKRPSTDSRFFMPPGNGGGGGDPHFTTLDGTTYTFNPIGEFVYLKSNNEIIQVRIAQYRDNQGIRKQACYFSAFVIQHQQSDKLQVDLSALKLFIFRINEQAVNLDLGLWTFNGITVNYQNNATVVIYTESELGIEFCISGDVLHAIITTPETAKGNIHGLIGNWDDNPLNDLQLPNGTSIPITSSMEDIHYKFGMAWSTTNITSLFYYPSGLSWSDFQSPSFVPSFQTLPANPVCNGDRECEYDISVTGNENVGLGNVQTKLRAQEIKEFNSLISNYCPLSVTVTNGDVTVEQIALETHVRYTVRCHEGFELYGSAQVTCVNGKYDLIGVCLD